MPEKLYNVLPLDIIGNPSKWKADFASWDALNREIVGDGASNFNPLTIKAFYITGIILLACKSVTLLLNKSRSFQETFFPAYGVFASAIELLGRCVNGNTTSSDNSKDLTTGFKWLASPKADSYQAVLENDILIKTINYEYRIIDLVNFRHFCAHGQAVNRLPGEFDFYILGEMPSLMGVGIEAWFCWGSLESDKETGTTSVSKECLSCASNTCKTRYGDCGSTR